MDFIFIILINTTLIFIFSSYAEKISLIDIPNNRKLHKQNTPLIGGISLYLTLLFVIFFLKKIEVNFYYYLFIFSGFIVFVGLLDDYKNINYKIRTILILLITLCLIYLTDIYIVNIGFFFNLDITNLKYVGIFLTLFAVFALVNAFNFLDGVDGLSAIQSISIFLLIYFYNYYFSLDHEMLFIFYLILSILIFFIFNFVIKNKYKIFLGDAGSMLLGFIIAWLCIFLTQNNNPIPVVLIPWILSYPIFDLISTVLIRIRDRKSPFKPDHNHLHFILMKNINLKKGYINLIILLISIILNVLGFILYSFLIEEYIYMVYIITFFIFHYFKQKYIN